MAPAKPKTSKATTDPAHEEPNFQQQNATLQPQSRTPTHISTKTTMMITEAQKQALIDNLQLEGIVSLSFLICCMTK